jgi:hypothetical protein
MELSELRQLKGSGMSQIAMDLVRAPEVVYAIAPHVDGDTLVIPSGCVMPPRCIKTNQPVSESDMVQGKVYWLSPWFLLLFIISGLLLVFAYFFARRKCKITYGLDPAIRKKLKTRTRIKAAAAILFLVALIVTSGSASLPAAVPTTCFILFLVAVIALFLGNSPLYVTRYREGVFWVRGCSPDYLASLRFD